MNYKVKVKKLTEDATIPYYSREGDAAFDLVSAGFYLVTPRDQTKIGTGISMEIPTGFEVEVCPRSGLSMKTPLRIANTPGTIDENYRGEVGVLLDNIADRSFLSGKVILLDGTQMYPEEVEKIFGYKLSQNSFDYPTYLVCKGDRIAQGKLKPVYTAHFEEVDELSKTIRGTDGFGSSGIKAK